MRDTTFEGEACEKTLNAPYRDGVPRAVGGSVGPTRHGPTRDAVEVDVYVVRVARLLYVGYVVPSAELNDWTCRSRFSR